MTKNDQKVLELIQEVYFDLCDAIEGNSYKTIGYDSKLDFLLAQRDKLAELEYRLRLQTAEA